MDNIMKYLDVINELTGEIKRLNEQLALVKASEDLWFTKFQEYKEKYESKEEAKNEYD